MKDFATLCIFLTTYCTFMIFSYSCLAICFEYLYELLGRTRKEMELFSDDEASLNTKRGKSSKHWNFEVNENFASAFESRKRKEELSQRKFFLTRCPGHDLTRFLLSARKIWSRR